jgi:triosephosphate isomerase
MRLELPIIILNFKSHRETTGQQAENLALIAEKVSRDTGITVAIAAQATDIYRLSRRVKIPILAQHVDAEDPGNYTGHITAYAVKGAGGVGSLLNHSEKRLLLMDIAKAIAALRAEDLVSVLCTDTPFTSIAGAALRPDFLAVEAPELIGTGISVAKAKPEIITKTIELVNELSLNIPILCGAGITDMNDVSRAFDLGVDGVLLTTAFVKSNDKYGLLFSMCKAAIEHYKR